MSYKSFSSCRYATLRRVVVAVTNGAFLSTSSYDVGVALELKISILNGNAVCSDITSVRAVQYGYAVFSQFTKSAERTHTRNSFEQPEVSVRK